MKKSNPSKANRSIKNPGQDLRRQAETKLSKNKQKKAAAPGMDTDSLHLLHELQMHQVELEMQNDELRRAQAELDASRARYFDLYDLAPVGYCTLNEAGLILEANLTAANLLGVARGALVKQTLTRFIIPEDQDIHHLHHKQLFETGEPQAYKLRLVKEDGTTRFAWAHLESTIAHAKPTKGRPVSRVVLSDISERVRTEEALRQSEARYRSILEDQTELICRYLPDGRLSFVNEAYAQYYGETAQELINTNFIPHIPEPDISMIINKIAEITSQEPVVVYEHRIIKPDGEIRWQRWTHRGIFDDATGKLAEHQAVGNDITERKRADEARSRNTDHLQLRILRRRQADEALRQSEARYRSILEDQTELICRYLPDGRLSFVNEAYARYYGGTAHQLINTNFIPHVPEPDISMVINKIAEITPQEPVIVYEHHITKPDGEIRWQRWTHRGIYDAAGNLIEHQAVGNDITERKQAEEALRESEERFRLAIQATKDGLWEWNIPTNQEFFSPRWCEIIGYSFDDPELAHTYISWAERIHPDDYERVMNALTDHLEKGARYDVDYRHRHKSGEYHWQNTSGQALFDEHGKPTKMVGRISDITERKRVEEALRMTEADYRAIFERAPVGIFRSTVDGHFVKVNQAMAKMYGYQLPEEMIDEIKSIAAQIYVDSSLRREFQSLLAKDGEVQGFVVQNRRRDGSMFWVSMNAHTVKNETGEILYYEGFIEDITERKQAEEQIQSLAKFPAEDPNPVLRVTRDGILLYINEAGLRFLPQWSLHIGETVHPILQEVASHSMKNGTTQTFDIEHGDRLYAFYVAPIVSAGYANLYGHDITESRQVKALRDAEARYHVLFEQSPYGIVLADFETTKTIEANEIASRQLGYTREEFADLNIPDYEASEKPGQMAQYMQKLIRAGSDDFETLHRAKSGGIRNVHVWVKALQLNERVLLYAIFQDITERKQAEQALKESDAALRESETKYRIVSNNTYDWEFWSDPEGRFIYTSPSCDRITGCTSDKFMADASLLDRIIHPDDLPGYNKHRHEVTESPAPGKVEFRVIRPDGNWRWIEQTCQPVFDDEDRFQGTRGSNRDITERKQMEDANEAYSREIALLEERQRIASDLHDAVSQALFSARLTAENLLRQPDRQADSFTHSLMDLNRLVRSASGEIRLILVELRNNALLNISLNSLLANLIDSGMARTNANLVFQCHVDNLVLPVQVKFAFYRIAQEAISNAIKHGKPDNINCTLRENEQMLEMIIQDDGTGFLIDKVSDDHFGLQIMRERADQAGVGLAIATQPGDGTSVTVWWKEEKYER